MKNAMFIVVALLAVPACAKKSGGDNKAAMAKMTELKDEMCKCKDAKCAQDVSDKMAKWSQEQAKTQKEPPKLSEADKKQANDLGQEIGRCMQAAMAASAPPPPAPAPAGSDTAPPPSAGSGTEVAGVEGMPKECAEYKAQVEKLKTCEKLPQKAREALIKAFNDASAGWVNLPEGAKAGLDKSCKAGAEAIVAATKEACGW